VYLIVEPKWPDRGAGRRRHDSARQLRLLAARPDSCL